MSDNDRLGTERGDTRTANDVRILERTTPFQGYYRVDRYRLRYRLFNGGISEIIQREVFERGHSVGVLMVDTQRDQVVLVEQFRMGAFAAKRPPWLLEVVAGVIDDGETAEEVARREAVEEAGCPLHEMIKICDYMVSPAGSSESVTLFCARVDCEGIGGVHGLPEEHEDIKVHILPVETAISLLDDNRIDNGITVVALHWLARNYERLKHDWPVSPVHGAKSEDA